MNTVYRRISLRKEQRIRLFRGDTDGFFEILLLPLIGVTGEKGFFGKFIEGKKGNGLPQVVFCPFVIVVFCEATGVCAGDEVIVIEGGIDDGMKDVVEKGFGGRVMGRGWLGF